MRRIAPAAAVVGALAFVLAVVAGGLVPNVAAAGPDKSDVVLEFDFSASITNDKATRNQFGAALEEIAARVNETAADLVSGDTTVSLIQFATKAADVPTCVDVRLLNDPTAVTHFADCLRRVAQAYRTGGSAALKRTIGIDTNYVAALQQAGVHLPTDAIRPAIIFFTDGRHDVKGVPFAAVITERDKLVDGRASIALLPVGMGLASKDRGALQKGLNDLQVIRGIPSCAATGSGLQWPTTVFTTPKDAGSAVGTALADATCTFTVAPTPSPTPPPLPAPISDLRLTAGDGKIDLIWAPAPRSAAAPVIDYDARCKPTDGGDWVESTEGVSLTPKATIEGLTNGVAYQCEVASVSETGPGAFTTGGGTATPIGPPAAPAAPTITGDAGAVDVSLAKQAGVDSYDIECSPDGGSSWPATGVASGDNPSTQVGDLANGTEYVCRAYAENAAGKSDASPISNVVKPCSGVLQCNPVVIPVLGGVGGLLVLALVGAFVFATRGRQSGHVVAVVDVVHTANIGHGTNLGIGFVQSPETRRVIGIVAEKAGKADVRIRRLRSGQFEVRDKTGTHVIEDGGTTIVADPVGGRHSLSLRAFSTNAASQVATRR